MDDDDFADGAYNQPEKFLAVVADPTNSSAADGSSQNPLLAGRQSDLLISQLHARYASQVYRGRIFCARSAHSLSTIRAPIPSTNLTTFGVYNPDGSGVNLEILSVLMWFDGTMVNAYPWVSVTGAVLTTLLTQTSTNAVSVLAGGVKNLFLGQGQQPKSLNFNSFLSPTSTDLYSIVLGGQMATTDVNVIKIPVAGYIIQPPGSLFYPTGLLGGQSGIFIQVIYAEVPV